MCTGWNAPSPCKGKSTDACWFPEAAMGVEDRGGGQPERIGVCEKNRTNGTENEREKYSEIIKGNLLITNNN